MQPTAEKTSKGSSSQSSNTAAHGSAQPSSASLQLRCNSCEQAHTRAGTRPPLMHWLFRAQPNSRGHCSEHLRYGWSHSGLLLSFTSNSATQGRSITYCSGTTLRERRLEKYPNQIPSQCHLNSQILSRHSLKLCSHFPFHLAGNATTHHTHLQNPGPFHITHQLPPPGTIIKVLRLLLQLPQAQEASVSSEKNNCPFVPLCFPCPASCLSPCLQT